ncbi:MAG: PaaI family thioesterase [Hyphomicrobiales bacterium]|nr:PaaI family thioesterase [Hyphomicrobiales bacterium]
MTDRAYGVATPDQIAGLSGLEILQAIIAGRLPQATISQRLDFWIVEAREGYAVFEGQPSAGLLNPMGTVHGGWSLTLIDSATGCACLTLQPPGVGYTTVETKGNFTRAITAKTGRVRCEGRVIAAGKQIVTTEARILDSDGRVLSHGTSTLLVLPPRSA